MTDPSYQGRAQAIHVEADGMSVPITPVGPVTDGATYRGMKALQVLPRSPGGMAIDELLGPLVYHNPHLHGRSQAIHVFGSGGFGTPPPPVDSCEDGRGGEDGGGFNECIDCAGGIADTFGRPDHALSDTLSFGVADCGVPWRSGSAVGEGSTSTNNFGGIESGLAKMVTTVGAVVGIQASNRHVLAVEERNLPDGVARKALTGTIKFKADKDTTDLTGSQILCPITVGMTGNGGTIRVRHQGPTGSQPGTRINFAIGNVSTNENFACPIAIVKNAWYVLRFYIEEGQHMRAKVWADGDPEPSDWVTSTITSTALTRFEGIQVGHQHSAVSTTLTGYFDDLAIDGVDGCSESFFDNLHRAVSSGWGTSDSGFLWTNSSPVPSSPSVNTTSGGALSASNADKVEMTALGASVAEAPWMQDGGWVYSTRLRTSSVPASAGDYLEQETLVEEPSGDKASLRLRVGNGTGSTGEIKLDCTGFPVTTVTKKNWISSVDYFVRWEFRPGEVARARVWAASVIEPSTWDVDLVPDSADADVTTMTHLVVRVAKTSGLGAGLAFGFRFVDFKPDPALTCHHIIGGGQNCPSSDLASKVFSGFGFVNALVPSVDVGGTLVVALGDYLFILLNLFGSSASVASGPAGWTPHPDNGVALGTGSTWIWYITGTTMPASPNLITFSAPSGYNINYVEYKDIDSLEFGTASGTGPDLAFGSYPAVSGKHIRVEALGLALSRDPVSPTGPSSERNFLTRLALTTAIGDPGGVVMEELDGGLIHDYPYEDSPTHEITGTGPAVAYSVLTFAVYQTRDCVGAYSLPGPCVECGGAGITDSFSRSAEGSITGNTSDAGPFLGKSDSKVDWRVVLWNEDEAATVAVSVDGNEWQTRIEVPTNGRFAYAMAYLRTKVPNQLGTTKRFKFRFGNIPPGDVTLRIVFDAVGVGFGSDIATGAFGGTEGLGTAGRGSPFVQINKHGAGSPPDNNPSEMGFTLVDWPSSPLGNTGSYNAPTAIPADFWAEGVQYTFSLVTQRDFPTVGTDTTTATVATDSQSYSSIVASHAVATGGNDPVYRNAITNPGIAFARSAHLNAAGEGWVVYVDDVDIPEIALAAGSPCVPHVVDDFHRSALGWGDASSGQTWAPDLGVINNVTFSTFLPADYVNPHPLIPFDVTGVASIEADGNTDADCVFAAELPSGGGEDWESSGGFTMTGVFSLYNVVDTLHSTIRISLMDAFGNPHGDMRINADTRRAGESGAVESGSLSVEDIGAFVEKLDWLTEADGKAYWWKWQRIPEAFSRLKVWVVGTDEPDAWDVTAQALSVPVPSVPAPSSLRVRVDPGSGPGLTDLDLVNIYTIRTEAGADCVQCESTVPFVANFLPTFRYQIGDPTTRLDSFICTLESGAMALDWETRGGVSLWGGELIPFCGRSESQIISIPGTNLGNVKTAWQHFGRNFEIRSGQTWAHLQQCLVEGRAVVLQGDYGVLPAGAKCQLSFEGNHAILLLPFQVGTKILTGDPLCRDFHGRYESHLKEYAEALGAATYGAQSPQPILFGVSSRWST